MKIRIPSVVILAGALALTACNTAQVESSAAFVGAEVATTQIISKNPALIPVAQAIVTDWTAFQGGKLTSVQEAGLLQQVVAATKGQVTPTEAALLDGAVQQILANTPARCCRCDHPDCGQRHPAGHRGRADARSHPVIPCRIGPRASY